MHELVMKIFSLVSDLGYFGIALGLMIEIVPSEIVLSYGGFLVSTGQVSFIGAVIAGVIGGTIAQMFLYWLGYFGGRPAVLKYGKYLLIKEKHVEMAEKWFERYGAGVVFTARFIPVVRHAISIPAGMAKMSLKTFTLLTAIASIPWSILFITLGMKLGQHWDNIENVAGNYTKPIGIAVVAIVVIYVGIKVVKKNKIKSSS